MMKELQAIVLDLRPAFSRRATYLWFVMAFIGMTVRTDTFGVSSVVRALFLAPAHYPSLLHFFHSTAWTAEGLMTIWWQRLKQQGHGYKVEDRLVLVGDHTKTPKDGRKMPAVTTLHQDSETGSKPSYFRGHHWGCIAVVMQAAGRFFATPLLATIQEGMADLDESRNVPKTIQTVQLAQRIAETMGHSTLVLDAFFSVGPVFAEAAKVWREGKQLIHILTRAKKNVVAFIPAPEPKKKKRGRKKKYGKKLKLMKLFDSTAKQYEFKPAEALIYDKREAIRYLVLDLLWQPTKGLLRFILIESSHGRMVLITADFSLQPVTAVELYCRRVTIETMFDVLKNTLGGLAYHFWSTYLSAASRKPLKNADNKQKSRDRVRTSQTLAAIEKFVNLQLLVLGTLQIIAKLYPLEVMTKARCWLRTQSSKTPSEFVTRMALANVIRANLCGFGKNWITSLIQQRQENPENKDVDAKVA